MNNKTDGKSVGAMILGAAVGAAAMFLSDEKNRDSIKKKYKEFNSKGGKAIEKTAKKADGIKKDIDKTVKKVQKADEN